MSPVGAIRLLYELLLVLALIPSFGFVVHYSIVYPWWRSEIGRHIVAFSSSIGALLLHSLIAFLFPTWPGRNWIRLALFIALIVVIWWRWVVFIRVRKEDRNHG
ncbi:MAG TPA: hypothetical protein VJT49_14875 [Amycolatopsis sp.]|uniref:putative phage holin n=1 Tax=Amycolatopsis sp. TaxID=37632 RepID=UPI002B488DE1|nr:hypothetical protein [Amycolatopsis sp.]HKS46362.1 hypothetical protein [Amycolatopsis sp.]